MITTREEKIKKQFEICNISQYHENGFTGKGITILNHEANTGHAYMTNNIIKSIAPEATIINAIVSNRVSGGKIVSYTFEIDGVKYTPEAMYNTFKPDIMSVSFIGSNSELKCEILKPYIDQGLNIVCATGNKGGEGVFGYYKANAINIGSVDLNNKTEKIQLNSYSGRGELGEVTFVSFNGDGEGTSAATPFFAGILALFMQRFGKFHQSKNIELIQKCCIDIGNDGQDSSHGYGLFVLPEIISNGEDDYMSKFVDVEDTRWSIKAINWAEEENLVNGYEDGTFRPDQTLTREEFLVVLKRFKDKYIGG